MHPQQSATPSDATGPVTEPEVSASTLRRIDLLIAEHVFGFRWVRIPGPSGLGDLLLASPAVLERYPHAEAASPGPLAPYAEAMIHHYTGGITAAWPVVEEMERREEFPRLKSFLIEKWKCGWYAEFPPIWATGDTPAEAICRAALAALGVEVPE